MSNHKFNGIEAAKIAKIELINGHAFTDCFLDPFTESPPGFIAIRASTVEAGKPELIKFIRVSSIACFNIDEREAGKLWEQFNPLPETISTKQL